MKSSHINASKRETVGNKIHIEFTNMLPKQLTMYSCYGTNFIEHWKWNPVMQNMQFQEVSFRIQSA